MSVHCLETVVVTNYYIETVTTTLEARQTHATRECRVNGVTDCSTQVDTLVSATELGTVAIVAGHIVTLNGHHIVADVKHLGVGYVGVFIAVNEIALPTLGVDIGFGFALFIEVCGIFLGLP